MAEDSGKTGFEFIGPANNAQAVTEHETNYVDPYPRALWIGGAGDLVVDMVGGQKAVTFAAVPAGTLMPIRVTKVRTASTVSSVVAIW